MYVGLKKSGLVQIDKECYCGEIRKITYLHDGKRCGPTQGRVNRGHGGGFLSCTHLERATGADLLYWDYRSPIFTVRQSLERT